MEVLVFDMGGQRFGLPADDVLEIARAASIVPLPRAPVIVEGVLDLRGRLVPVLDLRSRFRLRAKPLEPSDHFIVATAGIRQVVVRADRAEALASIELLADLDAAVPGAGYVAGVARLPDGLVLIHDLRSFLSEAEAIQLDTALDAATRAQPVE